MKTLLNTLYVQTSGAYLHLDHETLKVEIDKELRLQVPLHHLGSLVLFGEVMVSPGLLGRCAQDGRPVIWLSRSGRFLGRWRGRFPAMSCCAGPSTRRWTHPAGLWRWLGTWWPANSRTNAM